MELKHWIVGATGALTLGIIATATQVASRFQGCRWSDFQRGQGCHPALLVAQRGESAVVAMTAGELLAIATATATTTSTILPNGLSAAEVGGT